MRVRSPVSKYPDFQKAGFWNNRPLALYIVDFRSAGWLPYVFKYRYALRAKRFGSRVCFSLCGYVAPSQDGERAKLDNWQTLLGAKDGGRHQSGARIGVDELVVRYDVAP